jgi:hypothetical protein
MGWDRYLRNLFTAGALAVIRYANQRRLASAMVHRIVWRGDPPRSRPSRSRLAIARIGKNGENGRPVASLLWRVDRYSSADAAEPLRWKRAQAIEARGIACHAAFQF